MVYDYQCGKCGAEFEINATIKEKEAGIHPRCPRCGDDRTRQRFTGFGIISGSKSAGGKQGAPVFRGCGTGEGCCG